MCDYSNRVLTAECYNTLNGSVAAAAACRQGFYQGIFWRGELPPKVTTLNDK